jgi:hypothetical protein
VIEVRNAAVHERLERRVDQAGLIQASPHRPGASKDRWPACIHQVVNERCTPPFGLCLEDGPNRSFRLLRIDTQYAHGSSPPNGQLPTILPVIRKLTEEGYGEDSAWSNLREAGR